jgi:peptidoglycan biosynthesis protein MviN/MurJ (putative lipid II flippase)
MRVTIFWTLLFLTAFYAFRRGEKPERITAFTMVSMIFADLALHIIISNTDALINMSHLILDSLLWFILMGLALKANRLWTLLVAALQTVTLCSHVVRIFGIDINPQAYGIMQVAAAYPMLLILAIGTWRHQQRRIQAGGDPSWSV